MHCYQCGKHLNGFSLGAVICEICANTLEEEEDYSSIEDYLSDEQMIGIDNDEFLNSIRDLFETVKI